MSSDRDKQVCLLRRPSGLSRLVSVWTGRRPGAAAVRSSWKFHHRLRFWLRERELGRPRPDRSGERRVAEAYRSLACVRSFNATVLADVLRVLIHTRPPADEKPQSLPLLRSIEDLPTFRPTAAHPRVYRGARRRPPKAALPEPMNLRPYLCDRAHTRRLLDRLRPLLPDALERLRRGGIPKRGLDRLNGACDGDPYLLYHHGDTGRRAEKWPALFRTMILPALRGRSGSEVRGVLGAYWNLNLGERPDLLGCAVRLLLESPDHGASWLARVATVPFEWQALLTDVLVRSRLARQEPGILSDADLHRCLVSLSPESARHQLNYFLQAIARGNSAAYLLDGFRLADRHEPDYKFEKTFPHGSDSPGAAIGAIVEHLETHRLCPDSSYHRRAMHLWERCGSLPGLADLIRGLRLRIFSSADLNLLLGLFADIEYYEFPPDIRNAKWQFLRTQVERIVSEVAAMPPAYRAKMIRLVDDFICWCPSDRLHAHFDDALAWGRRVCRAPHHVEAAALRVIWPVLRFAGTAGSDRLRALPASSVRAVDEFSSSLNKRSMARRGLWSLVRFDSDFSMDSLEQQPGALLRACRALGAATTPHQQVILDTWARHRLMRADAKRIRPKGLAALLRDCGESRLTNPLPRKLRDHLDGRIALTPGQIDRATDEMRRRLLLTRLQLLESVTMRVAARGLPLAPGDPAARHAVEMALLLDENRRALRRFLRGGAGSAYVWRHPNNRRWLTSQGGLRTKVWKRGIEMSGIADGRRVRLAVERDPLEVLRMGTYVGSCLGLGGMCVDAAVAAALDANKQVVYARGPGETVVARQLTAIGTDGRLVCYDVYPRGASDELRCLFETYDRQFAARLGVELHTHEIEEYPSVESLVARYWYDDGPWDFSAPKT